jgi:hypothetical protein
VSAYGVGVALSGVARGQRALLEADDVNCTAYPRARHSDSGATLSGIQSAERGGAAGAFAAEAVLSFLCSVVQRPCRGPHDVHGDGG